MMSRSRSQGTEVTIVTGSFSTLPQSILNEPWPRENACASGSCLDMASFLTYRVLAGNGEWHDGLCSPTMFSGSIPEPMWCNFHYISIPVCDAVPSKGPNITGIQYGFPALTLTHRDCSRFSESLDDIMHCR